MVGVHEIAEIHEKQNWTTTPPPPKEKPNWGVGWDQKRSGTTHPCLRVVLWTMHKTKDQKWQNIWRMRRNCNCSAQILSRCDPSRTLSVSVLFYIHVSTSFNNKLRTDIVPWNSTVADLECGIKNHQQWDWLEHDQDGEKFSPCLEKLQSVGRAYCTVCWMEIMYGTSGVYALKDHITGKPHKGQDSKHELLFARWNFLFCFMILSVLSTCNCDFGCCWSTIKNMTSLKNYIIHRVDICDF